MNRFFFSTLIITFCLAAGAEDVCSALCEHITAITAWFANGKSQSDCLDEFRDHWGKAQGPFLKKMDEYSCIMSGVAADLKSKDDAEQRIIANRKEVQELKDLVVGDRPEFEEPDDFRKRQEKAAARVKELESANQSLKQNIQLLEHRIQDGSKVLKPSVELNFKGVYESQLAYDNTVCDVGFFQIDKKSFPVHLKSLPKGGSEMKLDKHEDFVVETSLTFDCDEQQLGSFKSTEEAKKFKEEFLAGKAKINYKVNLDISVKNGRKDVLIKEGGEKLHMERSPRMSLWGGFGFLVNFLPQILSDTARLHATKVLSIMNSRSIKPIMRILLTVKYGQLLMLSKIVLKAQED